MLLILDKNELICINGVMIIKFQGLDCRALSEKSAKKSQLMRKKVSV